MSEVLPEPFELSFVPPSANILNQVAAEVAPEAIMSNEIQKLVQGMLDVARGRQGDPSRRTMVGVAAPQLGVDKRIVVFATNSTGMGERDLEFAVLINPKIVSRSEPTNPNREGCYSTSRVCGVVDRANWIKVEAFNDKAETVTATYDGFTARVVQHEIDHLDGIRFPERIPEDRELLWVDPDQFGKFRLEWDKWDVTCSRERWQAIKSGADDANL